MCIRPSPVVVVTRCGFFRSKFAYSSERFCPAHSGREILSQETHNACVFVRVRKSVVARVESFRYFARAESAVIAAAASARERVVCRSS